MATATANANAAKAAANANAVLRVRIIEPPGIKPTSKHEWFRYHQWDGVAITNGDSIGVMASSEPKGRERGTRNKRSLGGTASSSGVRTTKPGRRRRQNKNPRQGKTEEAGSNELQAHRFMEKPEAKRREQWQHMKE
jgi:hypothetical protein